MQNWSSWQGYAWLIHVCIGVYILCCGSRSIQIGCLYGGTSWPPSVHAVLLLFRPFCTCSCTRCANQKHSSHGVSCRTFTLGIVPQHHPHATERIVTLRLAQRRKIALKIFLEGSRSTWLFWCLDHTQESQVNFIWSFILTGLTSSAKLELSLFSFFLSSFPWRLHLARHSFLFDIY
jgi:hypothetical protein